MRTHDKYNFYINKLGDSFYHLFELYYKRKGTTMQREIIENTKLLNEQGNLNQPGYARSLILDYNRKDIKASSLRIKEWDYYLIYNDEYGIALTLADNSYMSLESISILDFKNAREKTVSQI